MAAADRSHKTDVFPTRIDEPRDVEKLPRVINFQAVVSEYKIYAFIVYMEERELIYYKPVEWNDRYQKHFFDTAGHVKPLQHYEEKPWSWAARKLKKDVADNLRKNIDTRTCFKYEVNFFLVKSCFTFGQRKVEAERVHVYQIGAVQMLFYYVERHNLHKVKQTSKFLPVDDQYKYKKKTLRPNECYYIPEGTIYLIYCTNKSFFSLHILRADQLRHLSFECINPIREAPRPNPVDHIYRRPVRTPLIEDAVIGDEEEEVEPPPPKRTSPYFATAAAAAATTATATTSAATTPWNDDPVLLDLDSGARVTEGMLMPPPPPPTTKMPPTTTQHKVITLMTFPLEKTVQVVRPDVSNWYRCMFKYKQYENPKEEVSDWGLSDQSEPMDLSATGTMNETAAAVASIQMDAARTPPVNNSLNVYGNAGTPSPNSMPNSLNVYNSPNSMPPVNPSPNEYVYGNAGTPSPNSMPTVNPSPNVYGNAGTPSPNSMPTVKPSSNEYVYTATSLNSMPPVNPSPNDFVYVNDNYSLTTAANDVNMPAAAPNYFTFEELFNTYNEDAMNLLKAFDV